MERTASKVFSFLQQQQPTRQGRCCCRLYYPLAGFLPSGLNPRLALLANKATEKGEKRGGGRAEGKREGGPGSMEQKKEE